MFLADRVNRSKNEPLLLSMFTLYYRLLKNNYFFLLQEQTGSQLCSVHVKQLYQVLKWNDNNDKDDNAIYVNYYNNRMLIFISFAYVF